MSKKDKASPELLAAFKKTLTATIVCPYCGEANQLDPPLLCCGENHAEEAYKNKDDEVIMESELHFEALSWARLEDHKSMMRVSKKIYKARGLI